MSHKSLLLRNDCEQKINYDWPYTRCCFSKTSGNTQSPRIIPYIGLKFTKR